MAKKYNPAAIDGDGDGLVQDGTDFERPATCANCVLVKDGDTYMSIAERLAPESALAEAERLYDLNNAKPLYPGLKVCTK